MQTITTSTYTHTHFPSNNSTPTTIDIVISNLDEQITINANILTTQGIETEIDKLTKTFQKITNKHGKIKHFNPKKEELKTN